MRGVGGGWEGDGWGMGHQTQSGAWRDTITSLTAWPHASSVYASQEGAVLRGEGDRFWKGVYTLLLSLKASWSL